MKNIGSIIFSRNKQVLQPRKKNYGCHCKKKADRSTTNERKVSPNYCKLCLTEKFFIIKSLDDSNLLNKTSELVSKSRHQISCYYVM